MISGKKEHFLSEDTEQRPTASRDVWIFDENEVLLDWC